MQKADPEHFLFKMILSALQKSKDAKVVEPKMRRGSVEPSHNLGDLSSLYKPRKDKGRKEEVFNSKPIGEIN